MQKFKSKKTLKAMKSARGYGSDARHGHASNGTVTPECRAYHAARNRCANPKNGKYANYGGRGIKFLFTSFEQFFAELGLRPSRQHSLDRKDNNGHYESGNVRWATRSQQIQNRRRTNAEITTSLWKDPVFRQRTTDALKKKWQDPAYRKRMLDSRKAAREKRIQCPL